MKLLVILFILNLYARIDIFRSIKIFAILAINILLISKSSKDRKN